MANNPDPPITPTTGAELRTLWRQTIEADTPDGAPEALTAYCAKWRPKGKPWPDKIGNETRPMPPATHRNARTCRARERAMDHYAAWLLPQLHRGVRVSQE